MCANPMRGLQKVGGDRFQTYVKSWRLTARRDDSKDARAASVADAVD